MENIKIIFTNYVDVNFSAEVTIDDLTNPNDFASEVIELLDNFQANYIKTIALNGTVFQLDSKTEFKIACWFVNQLAMFD